MPATEFKRLRKPMLPPLVALVACAQPPATDDELRSRLDNPGSKRRAEQPVVDRLWDHTLDEAATWLAPGCDAMIYPIQKPLRWETPRTLWQALQK